MDITERELTEDERTRLDADMTVIEGMSEQARMRMIRHILRAGYYYGRTKDTESLLSAVRSFFVSVHRYRDERYQKVLHEAEVPRKPIEAIGLDEALKMLAEQKERHGGTRQGIAR